MKKVVNGILWLKNIIFIPLKRLLLAIKYTIEKFFDILYEYVTWVFTSIGRFLKKFFEKLYEYVTWVFTMINTFFKKFVDIIYQILYKLVIKPFELFVKKFFYILYEYVTWIITKIAVFIKTIFISIGHGVEFVYINIVGFIQSIYRAIKKYFVTVLLILLSPLLYTDYWFTKILMTLNEASKKNKVLDL